MKNPYPKIRADLQEIAKKNPVMTFSKTNIWFIRLMMNLLPASKIPENVQVENLYIPRADNPKKMRLRIYKQKTTSAPTPALIWFHGGGHLIGKPEMDDFACGKFAHELGITIISVDYRLAPKHPFPAGLNDGYTTLQWVHANAQQLGADVNRIAVAGVSAGGGLAASLAQLVHDRHEFKLIFQLLIYPMLDDRTVLRAEIDDSNNMTWNQKSNRFAWESYLGQPCGAESTPEHSVPARRKDLSGLPPAWVGVGSVDIFHDENVNYAQRLKESGVECELHVVPGAFHGFDAFDPHVPIVEEFRGSQLSALRKYLLR